MTRDRYTLTFDATAARVAAVALIGFAFLTSPHSAAQDRSPRPGQEIVPGGSSAPMPLAQELRRSLVPRKPTTHPFQDVIAAVERGIGAGAVGDFSPHFASQVHISLRGEESGYFSANQAYYLFEQYFRTRRFTGCRFSTIGESDVGPYATGSATFTLKGVREAAQVYLSLTAAGDRWVISQINIY